MINKINKLYEFGDFRCDPQSKILWRGAEIIPLSPKAFEVLLVLLENDGKLVSKQEILNKVWAETFVEEGVLTQNIYTLRNTLGKDENGKQFIENIARRGYRFAAPIKVLKDEISERVFTAENFPDEIVIKPANDFAPPAPLENISDSAPGINSIAKNSPAFFSNPKIAEAESKPEADSRFSARRPALFFVCGIFVFFLLAAVLYQFFVRSDAGDQSKPAPIEQLRLQRLTDLGDVIFPTISPDGQLLAYVRIEDRQGSVWVKQIDSDNPLQILPSSSKGYKSLAFSKDGKFLYYREENESSPIYRTSVLGGTPKKIAENVWSDFSISPDGTQFAFFRRDAARKAHLLIARNIDGGSEKELSARGSPLDYRGIPAWSPDGEKILVTAGVQDEIFPKLLTVDVSTGGSSELKTSKWRAVLHALWMPDGKRLVISAREGSEPSSQIWMLDYPEGEIRRLTNDLEGYFWLSMSADGRTLVARQQRIISHLWLLPDGELDQARQITFGERSFDGYVGLAWTRDDKIIYSVRTDHITDLFRINPDGSSRVQLTANGGQDNTYPTVTSDNRYIVFTSNRTGSTQIWRMDSDGGNVKQLTFSEDQTEGAQYPALSPDGKDIFFIRRGKSPVAIWKVPIDGGGSAVQISHFPDAAPESFLSVSPDGKWLAYRHISAPSETPANDLPTTRIGVIQTDGQGSPKFFDLPMRRPFIQWAADSLSFDYSAGTFNSSSLVRQSIDGGESRKLLDFPDRIYNFARSPDGKNLVVSRGKLRGDAILITNMP